MRAKGDVGDEASRRGSHDLPKRTYENTETDFYVYRNGLERRLVLSPYTYIGIGTG